MRKNKKPEPGTCVACGCTDERACAGGCYWMNPDHTVCSACYIKAIKILRVAGFRMVRRAYRSPWPSPPRSDGK